MHHTAQSVSVIDSDPNKYVLDPHDLRIWSNYLYDSVGATLDKPFRRAAVSIATGLVLYFVNFSIASLVGFVDTFIRTPAIYILALACMFFIGRARWLSLELIERIKAVRDVFAIRDATFLQETSTIARRITSLRITIPLTLLAIVIGWAGVAIAYLVPTYVPPTLLRVLEPATFPHAWFSGPHLVGKMVMMDYMVASTLVFTVPLVIGTALGFPLVIRMVDNWPVVPVPAYVTAKLTAAGQFFFTGASYYAVAVLVLVLLYAGAQDPLFIMVIAIFICAGLLCVIAPIIIIARLVDRARQQIAAVISTQYFQYIYPAGVNGSVGTEESVDGAIRVLTKIIELEKMMQAANESSGLERQLGAFIPGILTQSLPLIGFLLSAALKAR